MAKSHLYSPCLFIILPSFSLILSKPSNRLQDEAPNRRLKHDPPIFSVIATFHCSHTGLDTRIPPCLFWSCKVMSAPPHLSPLLLFPLFEYLLSFLSYLSSPPTLSFPCIFVPPIRENYWIIGLDASSHGRGVSLTISPLPPYRCPPI